MPGSFNHLNSLRLTDDRELARAISLVENNVEGYAEWLAGLKINSNVPVIGITGPPGAGKSTVVNELIKQFVADGKRIGILAIDPTSPFNLGALLGDRIRMVQHFNSRQVFIRSLATRGSLGGLSAKTIEISELMRAADFDYILIETVGVGQSEVEIAGLADTTVLVLVPEAGDEIQNLKSGIMEIADIFVVNKSDRAGASQFAANLKKIIHNKLNKDWEIPVIKAVATEGTGIDELAKAIDKHGKNKTDLHRRAQLLADRAYHVIASYKMQGFDRGNVISAIEEHLQKDDFNFYHLVSSFTGKE